MVVSDWLVREFSVGHVFGCEVCVAYVIPIMWGLIKEFLLSRVLELISIICTLFLKMSGIIVKIAI